MCRGVLYVRELYSKRKLSGDERQRISAKYDNHSAQEINFKKRSTVVLVRVHLVSYKLLHGNSFSFTPGETFRKRSAKKTVNNVVEVMEYLQSRYFVYYT